MPVNLIQYRGVVGAFNSQFIHIKQHHIFRNAFRQNKVKQTTAKKIFTRYLSFLILLLISRSLSFINFIQIKAKFISS